MNLIRFHPEPMSLTTLPRSSSLSQSWNFLSNHAHVLVCLDKDPQSVMRAVAAEVGITERAVQKIVAELEAAGVVQRERIGRRNRYIINRDVRLRHNLEAHCRVGDLLNLVN
jgi:DNA-binding MarR family transcriptional regulator